MEPGNASETDSLTPEQTDLLKRNKETFCNDMAKIVMMKTAFKANKIKVPRALLSA